LPTILPGIALGLGLLAGLARAGAPSTPSAEPQPRGGYGNQAAYEELTLEAEAMVALVQEVTAAPAADPTAHTCHPGDHASYDACQPCSTQAAVETCTKKLNKALSRNPSAWAPVGAEIERQFAAVTPDYTRERLLKLLAITASDQGRAVAAGLLERTPELFDSDQLLAFAEQESKPFVHELQHRLATCPEDQRATLAVPAAFFAFHGKAVGREHLLAASAPGTCPDGAARALVAATALQHLGDDAPLQRVREHVHAQTLAALDAGDLDRARRLALEAEFFRTALEPSGYGKQPSLVKLDERLHWHCWKRQQELAGPAEVFELIEAVTPL
jgi:hypothetical protein